ncbi:hypothetical protein L2E82_34160 [Cichorium intybus]|uniref:Uncharacterized protein n=1 Tax=Cichorium intybus TaxID=13427 RepID=A0ACB9BLM4_CICIN|nr:hypothetical protein L2E82_34160 [Cichorium intybus]
MEATGCRLRPLLRLRPLISPSSGSLRAYRLLSSSSDILGYVNVKEINYVTDNNKNTNIIKRIFLEESGLEKRRKRLHLWQVFFSNPLEWRDLRKSKINPRQPDFTHRGTDEALWISMYDLPWVMKQLQLQDS